MTVSLLPVPSLSPPTPLVKAKAAFSFAIFSSLEHSVPAGAESPTGADFSSAHLKTKTIPVMVTQLIVGCRRKLVMYSWRDGEAQEVKVRRSPIRMTCISPENKLGSSTSSFSPCNSVPKLRDVILRLLSYRARYILHSHPHSDRHITHPQPNRRTRRRCHWLRDECTHWLDWIHDSRLRCKAEAADSSPG